MEAVTRDVGNKMIGSVLFRLGLFALVGLIVWGIGFPLIVDVIIFVGLGVIFVLSRIHKILLLTITLIASIGFLELAVSVIVAHEFGEVFYRPHEKYEQARGYEPNVDEYFSMPHGDLAAIDPSLPQSIFRPRKVHFRTDDRGFRNDFSYAGDSIILAGDSFVVGTGNDQKDVLANVLRREHGIDAYSIAFAAGPEEYFDTIASFSTEIKSAQFLLFVFEGNDFRGPGRGLAKPSAYDRLKLRFQRFLGPDFKMGHIVFNNTRRWLRLFYPDKKSIVEIYRIGNKKIAFYGSYLDRASADVLDFDSKSLDSEIASYIAGVFFIPTKFRVYNQFLSGRLEQVLVPPPGVVTLENIFSPYNIPVLDLTPPLVQRAYSLIQEEDFVYWEDDTHWNGQGIRVAAEEIAVFLASVR